MAGSSYNLERIFTRIFLERNDAVVEKTVDNVSVKHLNCDIDLPASEDWERGNKVLIREEYDEIWREIKTLQNKPRINFARGIMITGQPGVGKTLCLYYLLACGLHDPDLEMIYCENTNYCYLFNKQAGQVQQFDFRDPAFPYRFGKLPPNAIVLYDTKAPNIVPDSPFTDMSSRCLIVQAASPAHHPTTTWLKQLTGYKWPMDLWTRDEVLKLQKLLPMDLRPPGIFSPLELFDIVGPSPRRFLETFSNLDSIRTSKTRVVPFQRLEEFVPALAGAVLSDTNRSDEFHSIFFATWNKELPRLKGPLIPFDRMFDYTVPTRFLYQSVFGEYRKRLEVEQKEILKLFRPIPNIAPVVFESLVIMVIQHRQNPLEYNVVQGAQNVFPKVVRSVDLPSLAPRSFPLNILWIAPPGFPTIDGAVVYQGGKHVTMLQATIAARHDLKAEGLGKIISLFPCLAQNENSVTFELVFLVIDEDYGKDLVRRRGGKISVYLPGSVRVGIPTSHKIKIEIKLGYCVIPKDVQAMGLEVGQHIPTPDVDS